MDKEILRRLELVNQLSLTDSQREEILQFFDRRDCDMDIINAIDTDNVERMVHVMPILTVVREDIASQPFTREQLQSGAPDTDQGYWCVPRVVD